MKPFPAKIPLHNFGLDAARLRNYTAGMKPTVPRMSGPIRLFVSLCLALLPWTPSAVGQEKGKARLPQVDWYDNAAVWLATAVAKGEEVEIRVSVPMWGPKPDLKGKDPQGAEDFIASEMKASLKSSDVKVYRKNGKLVESKELRRLLARETPVFWWRMEKIDPYYLGIMRDDVLIFVVDLQKVIKAAEGATQPATAPKSGS